MVKYTDSTVFNVGADCIVNTINCVGFMGKGIALEFALRYPKLEEQYIKQCKNKQIHTGRVYFYDIEGQKILNFPTKFHFKYPSQIEWIEQGLQFVVEHYKEWNIKSIAFPLLGANNGGLSPQLVKKVMEQYLSKLDIDVYICGSKLLEGKELEMVEAFKNHDIEDFKKYIRLNKKQVISLQNLQKHIKRFYEILDADHIGIDTYKSLFALLYEGKYLMNDQISLL